MRNTRPYILIAIAWSALVGAQQVSSPLPAEWPGGGSPDGHQSAQGSAEWGSVLISGRSASERVECPNAAGLSTLQLAVRDVPSAMAYAAVSCKFVPWSTLRDLKNATEQYVGKVTKENSSHALASLMNIVYSAETSSAQQIVLTSSRAAWKTNDFNVTCPFNSALEDAAVIVFSRLDSHSTQGLLHLTLGSTQLGHSAVHSYTPEVGPLSGGTVIEFQGAGFNESISCAFGNASFVQTVTGQVSQDGNATCTVPQWPAGISNSSNGTAVNLNVTVGGCQYNLSYGYYAPPMVRQVHPEWGPRYGSFLLTVELEDSLDMLSHGQGYLSLTPVLKLEGAQLDGGDLLLSANLSSDRRSLTALTPLSEMPLSAGDHPLQLSLNGRFTGQERRDLVVTLKGPSISMGVPYIHAGSNASVSVPVQLSGPNTLPVSVGVSISQRTLTRGGALQVGLPPAELAAAAQSAAVRWQPGENGTVEFTLPLTAAYDMLQQGALVLELENVTNADLSTELGTTLISALAQDNLTVALAMQPNQVAYHEQAVVVPFQITESVLRVPVSVPYTVHSLAGNNVTAFVPEQHAEGLLQWDQQPGAELNLTIPVNWKAIPPQAEHRLGLSFGPAWNAVVTGGLNQTAVHIFGVLPDQCPPGTYRSNATQPMGLGRQRGSRLVELHGIVVHGQNGTVYDLSSAFKPEVDEYGASVPPAFVNGSLCILPGNDALEVAVYAPDGSPLQQRYSAGSPASSHNRRSLSQAAAAAGSPSGAASAPEATTTAGFAGLPPAAQLAGVSAMTANNATASIAAESMCRQHSWPLSLEPGQNQFTIQVTASQGGYGYGDSLERLRPASIGSAPPARYHSSAPAPAHGPSSAAWTPHATLDAANSPSPSVEEGDDNVTETYRLSIVRLANAEHAELASLNASLSSNQSVAVCGGAGAAQGDAAANVTGSACVPGVPMWLNVTHDVDWVSLRPGLRWPGVTGIRVEVNGQVLSQGGDVAADQLEDTTAETINRASADFLPVAFVLGLAPGRATEVPIVVVAEDGVTSLRYFLSIFRAPGRADSTSSESDSPWPLEGDASSGSAASPSAGLGLLQSSSGSAPAEKENRMAELGPDSFSAKATRQPGWPVAPSQQPWCSTCPAGWASTGTDAASCQMCMPGSFAAAPQSPACTACGNGTYAYSWGSTHCNHCIIGTYAPKQGSWLCMMCPGNTTNLEDGSGSCPQAVLPGTNMTTRYAVIVSFGVYLNGTSLSDIAQKVGVNASSQDVLQHLIKADTASAFNISVGDVNVTGISQVSRRVLYVNVTATLGVNVPPNASPDDVRSALDMTNLSADDPIAMLAANPDRFFGRTTKALDVTAETDGRAPQRTEYRPFGSGSALGRAWPAIGAVLLLAVIAGCCLAWHWRRRSKRLQRICDAVLERCRRCRQGRGRWHTTAYITSVGDAPSVTPSSPGLVARSKAASVIRMQDAEPMYKDTTYSDGQSRSL